MSRSSFEEALARVLRDEGGYSNHPDDPGGPTKYGITLADARAYWKADAGADDVRALPLAAAKAIYRARYWDALRCDALPRGLDYAVFDYGVNSGVVRAGKALRRRLGLADRGGAIDADVLARLERADIAGLIERICDERMAFLRSLRTWPAFGRGWSRRVAGVRAAALAMAAPGPAAPAAPPDDARTPPAAPARPRLHRLIAALAAVFRRSRT